MHPMETGAYTQTPKQDVCEKQAKTNGIGMDPLSGNATIQSLRKTLHEKLWRSESEHTQIQAALDDLTDPTVQKVLRIIDLTR